MELRLEPEPEDDAHQGHILPRFCQLLIPLPLP